MHLGQRRGTIYAIVPHLRPGWRRALRSITDGPDRPRRPTPRGVASPASMPSKRDVLALLSRDELLAVVDKFDLSPPDRRAKDGLVETVAASKKATLAELLPDLSRDRLKELCRALGLDDGGREKTAAHRPAHRSEGGERDPVPRGRTAAARTSAPPVEIAPGDKLTTDKLEGYLWSAADILRGSIDSSDYKGFIFGLLFLKRLSDRFDEECEALQSQPNARPRRPRRARLLRPEARPLDRDPAGRHGRRGGAQQGVRRARAEERQARRRPRGHRLQRRAQARATPGTATACSSRLVQHFSRVSLRNANLSEPDMLGRAYEYLIEKFADDAGKKGGEFYTPQHGRPAHRRDPRPAPRDAHLRPDLRLGRHADRVRRTTSNGKGQNPRNLSLYGQEKNLGTWAICQMNTLLHGLPDARHREGRHDPRPQARRGRGADALRPRHRQPAVQPRRVGPRGCRARSASGASGSASPRRPRATSRSSSTWLPRRT